MCGLLIPSLHLFTSGNGVSETTLSIPHSITTWVVQGVGVSGTAGMCVAAPHQITVFRDFFVQLSLPYSVIRGEQIEVQATVYNYSPREIPVGLFLSNTFRNLHTCIHTYMHTYIHTYIYTY